MSRRILIVEDDPHIRLGLGDAIKAEGYEVASLADGAQAVPFVRQWQPHLVVLDVMLPHLSGYDVCRKLRAEKNSVPILMLTAKSQEIDKVVGLELGADDYLVKPFGLRELLARISALLRRCTKAETRATSLPERFQLGEVRVDTKALRITRNGRAILLTPRELAVLAVLYRERGNAVGREELLLEVWGQDYLGTNRSLDQVIVKLRQKIEADPAQPMHILTVHRMGYRLEVPS